MQQEPICTVLFCSTKVLAERQWQKAKDMNAQKPKI
ncbi:predicted protein [Plenodomus lingam JN3]|uniref:Predicted protein n=1 Tax=Leptosphaeria maculans (strain JN3 / isolate v23.1.3 / race Av1-4-5-6-7-8) TaxID=985895 RepID=E4ZSX8_LEPMJ|nr:predicted protein [Plenodomus lingam JN3]CBX94566.1 predicted protein [Plenodomus lingam JN3]